MLTSVDAQTQPSRFYLTFMFENLSDINSYCKRSQCLHTGFTHKVYTQGFTSGVDPHTYRYLCVHG